MKSGSCLPTQGVSLARKNGTLEQQRNEIKRKAKRGRTREKRIVGISSMDENTIAVKKEIACHLKASDYSHTYIGDALGVSKSIVKDWMAEPGCKEKVAKIQGDLLAAGVKLLKTYTIELIEMLIEIARHSEDDKIALQAIIEGLDRVGLSKVNKSESLATQLNKQEVDITDKTGLLDRMEGAPPEAQQQMAHKLAEMRAIATEHAKPEEHAK